MTTLLATRATLSVYIGSSGGCSVSHFGLGRGTGLGLRKRCWIWRAENLELLVVILLLSVITSRIVVTNRLVFFMLALSLVPDRNSAERTREELSRVGKASQVKAGMKRDPVCPGDRLAAL